MSGKNPVLAGVLDELGWSITRLVSEINTFMGQGYVRRSTVSEWVNHSRVPHEPLPTVVAHLLSDALGEHVDVDRLWQQSARHSPLWMPAVAGMDVPWNMAGTAAVLSDWLTNGGNLMDLDRRTFLAVSGAVLTGPAWDYVDSLGNGGRQALLGVGVDSGAKITTGMVGVIDQTIRGLRTLDDHEGGGEENLKFVHRHFRNVADYLKSGNFADARVGQRLLASWAQLSQIGGWMAYDAEQHGLAQRYFRTGLHAAHSAGDRDLGAHILACMTYQAVYRNRLHDGIELANAAMDAAEGTHPAVRALVASRFAFAQAAIGNQHAYRSALETAYSLLRGAGANQHRPAWLYWFDEEELDVQAGHSLIALAFASSRRPDRLLVEAEQLLAPKAGPRNTDSPRDGLVHGVWLARSYAQRGDLEQAVDVGWHALGQLEQVRSPRALALLRRLDEDLAARRGADKVSHVADFRGELRVATAA